MTTPAAHVLLVEDDDATREAVARNLEGHGYPASRRAATSPTPCARWDAERPDLILLDLGLPDLDGATVVRHVRRDATTPILILSARADERDKVADARGRRRRLRHQAVRHGRAAGADRSRAPARRRARPPIRAASSTLGPVVARYRAPGA